MKLRCPDCGSTNVDQYRMLTGAIWCSDCYFTASHKEKYNPFIINEENDQIVNDFHKKITENQKDIPADFARIIDNNF